jgi:hypothetical protein
MVWLHWDSRLTYLTALQAQSHLSALKVARQELKVAERRGQELQDELRSYKGLGIGTYVGGGGSVFGGDSDCGANHSHLHHRQALDQPNSPQVQAASHLEEG